MVLRQITEIDCLTHFLLELYCKYRILVEI